MAETSTTRDIVAKLWNLCHILRDDGVTYNEYVSELTFLLFLKMMAETGREEILPNGYRWSELDKRTGMEQLDYYKRLLLDLGTKGKTTVAAIFVDACDFSWNRDPATGLICIQSEPWRRWVHIGLPMTGRPG